MGRFLPDSLRGRLLLLWAIAVIPPIAIMVYVAQVQRGHEEGQARDAAQRLVRIASLEHEHAIDGVRRLLIATAALPEVRSHDFTTCSLLFQDLLVEYTDLSSLALADTGGRALVSVGDLPPGISFAGRGWFERAARGSEFAIGTPDTLRPSPVPAPLLCAYHVRDRSGRTHGVVVGALRLAWLEAVGQDLDLLPGGVLIVFDGRGRILARSPAGSAPVGGPVQDADLVRKARMLRVGVAETPGTAGVRRLYAFEPLASPTGVPLWVAVGVPRDAAFAAARRTFNRSLLLLGLLALALLLLGRLGGDLLVLRPVEALLEATRRVSAGDLSARTHPPYDPGELGLLRRAFDEMAATLQERSAGRDQAETALRQSEALKTAIVDAAPDGLVTLDPHGAIREFNGAAERMFQIPRAGALGNEAAALLLPDDLRDVFRRELRAYLESGGSAVIGRPLEWRGRRADGSEFPMSVLITPIRASDGPLLYSAYLRDLTELRRHEDALRSLSLVDEITGLYNRRGFLTFATQHLRGAARAHQRVLLLSADIDNLKQINDRFGHAQGDRAIAEAAFVLRTTFRESDLIARVGGDEFVVLATDTSGLGESRSLERLNERLAAHNRGGDRSWPLEMSTGAVAWDPEAPRPIEELLAEGDARMYARKRERQQQRTR